MTLFKHNYNILGKLKVYSRTVRNAMCLPDRERGLLLFILDRTLGWGRTSEIISTRQFIGGVSRPRGGRKIVFGMGTGLSAADVHDGLQHLQRLGAIRAVRQGNAVEYEVVEDWSHPNLDGSGMWGLNDADYDYEEVTGG